MGHFAGLQTFQFTALPFGLATAPLEFTKVVKEVKLMAQAKGIWIHQYLADWLLRAPCPETCQRHTQTLLDLCHSLGWVVNMAYPSTGLQFRRLPVRSVDWQGPSHSGPVDSSTRETELHQELEQLHSQAVHVFDRAAYGNGKTSVGRSSSHETFSVAPEAALACPRNSRKSYSSTPISPPTSRLVVDQEQCPSRTTVAPPSAFIPAVYRRLE